MSNDNKTKEQLLLLLWRETLFSIHIVGEADIELFQYFTGSPALQLKL